MQSRAFAVFALGLASFGLISVAPLACSSTPVPVIPETPDAGPCTNADSHHVDGGTCDSVLTWTDGPALAPARAQHSTFVLEKGGKAFLYAVGGTDYKTDFGDAWFAPIKDDGTLGGWAKTNALKSARNGTGVIVSNTLAIVIGGKLGTAIEGDAFYSFIQDDGTLAAWLDGPPLPAPVFGHGVVLGPPAGTPAEPQIYVTGGIQTATAVTKVYRSPVGTSGLGNWVEVTSLTSPRTHHTSFVSGNFLYVVGGYDNDPDAMGMPLSDVQRSAISTADGSLGKWTAAGTLDMPVAAASSVVHNGFVYLFGGTENGMISEHVRRASIASDGTVGSWSIVAPALPTARGFNAYTPLYKSRVYSVGGTADQKSAVGDVTIGTFQ